MGEEIVQPSAAASAGSSKRSTEIISLDAMFREYAWTEGHDGPVLNSEMEEIVAKALGLTQLLNHPQVHIEHLLLAMTLTESGKRRLRQHPEFDEAGLRDACWNAVKSYFRLSARTHRLEWHKDLKDVMEAAFELTRERDKLNRPLQVEDIFKIILEDKRFKDKFDPLVTNRPVSTPAEDALVEAKNIAATLGEFREETATRLEQVSARSNAQLAGIAQLDASVARSREAQAGLHDKVLTVEEFEERVAPIAGRVRNMRRFVIAQFSLTALIVGGLSVTAIHNLLQAIR